MLPGLRRIMESLMVKTLDKSLLVIVAKAPIAGKVKTRLCPELTPMQATELYRCFIEDRLTEIALIKGLDLAISFTPESSADYFTPFMTNGYKLFPQRGKNLGERLNNIFIDKSAEGYKAISIVDSDTPDLPRAIVQKSIEWLTTGHNEAVFGPCVDGGYYLVGLREPQPELFQDIPWSTSAVLQKTLEYADQKGIQTKLLPLWNDLDTFEDLLGFYHKHKDGVNREKNKWAGAKTFEYLSRLECIQRHFFSES